MRLCVIGAGYVGLVTAACFAEMGNQVRCVERDRERVARLRRGEMPIYEPGLESILRDQLDAARLTFTASLAEGLADAEVVFIAVGTPCGEDGSADLSHVMAVAEQLGAQLRQACIVVNKSTVPVGTAERVEEIIRLGLARRRKRFRVAVASNPEFLKEGSAVDDFRRPDRVIIGSAEAQAGETLRQLYAPFLRNHERVLLMGRREAEFSKYAANAFLATKISFMNEMAGLCALTGVDIEDVRRGMGSDKRIGTHFIYAGCGYGGSCFPKDVRALIRSAEQQGFDSQILRAVEARNARQKELLFETLGELFQGRWLMIASSSEAVTEAKAKEWAYDIELLAKNGYLKFADLTLLSNGVEQKATRYYVNESGSLANQRPGDARWPKVSNPHLRIVLSYNDSYTQQARENMSGKLKINWTTSYDDISHSQLTQSGGREYSSNGYGMERKDYTR